MTAKTTARPRKTTTRSRKKAAVSASSTALDMQDTEVENTPPAAGAPAEDKPAPKKRAPRRRTAKAESAAKPVADTATGEGATTEAVAEAAPKKPRAPARRRTKAATATRTAPATKVEAPVAVELQVPVTPTPEAAPTPVEPATPAAAEPVAEEPSLTFADLELSKPILQAIEEMGYKHPTPIQAQAIPAVLMARDVLGVAQTGTGKTASFTLPMLEILSGSRARARMPRSLILEPTRELALQVAENFVEYGKHLKLNHALLIGGESMADQKEVLNRGVDVLIATPGRLLDLFERGGLMLNHTKILVIDEADRMLDMGFIPDIEKIVSLLPPSRQTLFFSATMAPPIRKLADAFLHSPKEITVARQSSVATTITAGLIIVDEFSKRETLRLLLKDPELQNAIVFCNRKRDVDVLTKSLTKHGFSVGALHGDLPQSVRFSTLEKFKNNELKVLVCSDVAARGIDIGGLSHVFNFDLPFHAEDYVHRIGRTGRAGREGHAFSIATPYDKTLAEAIEQLTGKPIPRLSIEGVQQLEWSEEKRPRSGSQSRGGQNRKDKPAPQREREPNRTREATREREPNREREQQRPAQQQAVQPVANKPQPHNKGGRNQRDEIPPAPAGEFAGFGDQTPAFMLLPRRNSSRPATPGVLEAETVQDIAHVSDVAS
ncbi:MAG: DEAD/DEAH box helicase [Acetobacter sp.]|nr:DEAD/DEAH box helicase [Acetobacter lovaniensis]MCI1698482.1 DEAD/DEAH box helicase [Acetobacter lovaniensis]MCI1794638.1 DEAD/DEAH box helicase [Acetobacter lovaniensis]MCP1238767.1 DEAD/DEAH box helicase [Acetobacter lovaniensis]NHN80817.1 DEAD/DEAH box helicase [Acetobacter lovaniensis]